MTLYGQQMSCTASYVHLNLKERLFCLEAYFVLGAIMSFSVDCLQETPVVLTLFSSIKCSLKYNPLLPIHFMWAWRKEDV
jgi:hypothetical protein